MIHGLNIWKTLNLYGDLKNDLHHIIIMRDISWVLPTSCNSNHDLNHIFLPRRRAPKKNAISGASTLIIIFDLGNARKTSEHKRRNTYWHSDAVWVPQLQLVLQLLCCLCLQRILQDANLKLHFWYTSILPISHTCWQSPHPAESSPGWATVAAASRRRSRSKLLQPQFLVEKEWRGQPIDLLYKLTSCQVASCLSNRYGSKPLYPGEPKIIKIDGSSRSSSPKKMHMFYSVPK